MEALGDALLRVERYMAAISSYQMVWRCELGHTGAGTMLFQQQVAEALLETADEFLGWMEGEVSGQAGLLLGSEVMVTAHQRHPRFLLPPGSNSFQQARQIVIDNPDGEAIGDDAGNGKMLEDERTANREGRAFGIFSSRGRGYHAFVKEFVGLFNLPPERAHQRLISRLWSYSAVI